MRVDPAELLIEYKSYNEPFVAGFYMGEPILHHGRLHVVWNSPEGPFHLAWSVQGSAQSLGYPSDIEQMRATIAAAVAQAYDNSHKESTETRTSPTHDPVEPPDMQGDSA